MPEPTRNEIIVASFWRDEAFIGYEAALKVTADKFVMSCEDVERLVIADDELNGLDEDLSELSDTLDLEIDKDIE